jgi:hypothetical protein
MDRAKALMSISSIAWLLGQLAIATSPPPEIAAIPTGHQFRRQYHAYELRHAARPLATNKASHRNALLISHTFTDDIFSLASLSYGTTKFKSILTDDIVSGDCTRLMTNFAVKRSDMIKIALTICFYFNSFRFSIVSYR